MCAREWAQEQFGAVVLGDRRRSRRLVKMAAGFADAKSGTLPPAFPAWNDLKAAYRLLESGEISYDAVQQPHWDLTRQSCSDGGTYLMLEDTTDVSFTHRRQEVDGLGWTGDGRQRGFYLHSTLAVKLEGFDEDHEAIVDVVGLLWQQWWTRRGEPKNGREKRRERMSRERESQRCARVFSLEKKPEGARWIYVADRESDIYEAFARCEAAGVGFVIRGKENRALTDRSDKLFEAVSEAPLLGCFEAKLRSRPGVRARTAHVEVRSTTVTLRAPHRPGGHLPERTVGIVEAREANAPAGVEPIHWRLLTDQPCDSFLAARRLVGIYRVRWLLEEYHKALKTGVGVEKSQLSSGAALVALCAVLAVVAVRLVQLKLLGRTRPDQPVSADITGREVLAVLEAHWGKPAGGWTCARLLVAIARLGGFLARKSDGEPGWITIWRGWQKLMLLVEGYLLAGGKP